MSETIVSLLNYFAKKYAAAMKFQKLSPSEFTMHLAELTALIWLKVNYDPAICASAESRNDAAETISPVISWNPAGSIVIVLFAQVVEMAVPHCMDWLLIVDFIIYNN